MFPICEIGSAAIAINGIAINGIAINDIAINDIAINEENMQTGTTSWRGEYARLAGQLIGADPLIGREDLAERLSVPVDDVVDILARTHPLGPVLMRWRATKPGRGWAALERTNA